MEGSQMTDELYPLISVIVPVYNIEHYIARCVQSIINQDYPNLEVILIDDGSTDLSGKICDDFLEKDTRVKVIHKINGGLSSARNTGLDVALGKYISFIDGDDWVQKDFYSTLLTKIRDNDADIISCNSNSVNDDEALLKLGDDSNTDYYLYLGNSSYRSFPTSI